MGKKILPLLPTALSVWLALRDSEYYKEAKQLFEEIFLEIASR